MVQLSPLKSLPLISEAIGIVALVDKSKDTPNLGEASAAGRTTKAVIRVGQRAAADRAAQQREQIGRELRWSHSRLSDNNAPLVEGSLMNLISTSLGYRKTAASAR
jgi:hypothetical protein